METIAAPKKRIEWIDALRGATMILVVFSHVQISALGLTQSIVNNFFSMFRMPLFFFVSGFIAYQAQILWTGKEYRRRLLHKSRVQLLPMVFFGLLYAALIFTHKYHCSIPIAFKCFFLDRTHLGYWFTEVLLMMFILYYTLSLLLQSRPKMLQWIMVLLAIGFYLLSLKGVQFYSRFAVARVLCIHQLFLFFQFFVIGNITARHQDTLLKPLGQKRVCIAVIAAFITLFALYRGLSLIHAQSMLFRAANKVLLEMVRFCGMCAVISIFFSGRKRISINSPASRCLQFVGQRTLDIYLIHFFLLPLVSPIGKICNFNNNTLILTLFSLSTAIAVTIICLLISRIIRLSPILAQFILGVKRPHSA